MKGLTKVRAEWLKRICDSNGGGVRIAARVTEAGTVEPTSGPVRWLYSEGLIQGKAGGYERVVHTTEGLRLRRSLPA